jgi:plastocyanin
MQPGQTFKHIFYQAGTFEYYCTVHPATVGKVVVS